jgi:hypothetical protein
MYDEKEITKALNGEIGPSQPFLFFPFFWGPTEPLMPPAAPALHPFISGVLSAQISCRAKSHSSIPTVHL